MNTVRNINCAGKRVLLRADFNEPLIDGVVQDDARIRAVVPTIEFLLQQNPTSIKILTHLGRPEGRVVEALRTAPLAKALSKYVTDPRVEVLENVRFNPGEETNDKAFAQELAAQGDLFVNDAFADAHREHASIVGLPTLLPSFAGLLMEKEVEALTAALTPPPGSVAIVGGAKFETKIPLITRLLEHYDTVLLGGALGNDLIKARGMPFGASLVSAEPVPVEIAINQKLLMATDAYFGEEGKKIERVSTIADIRAHERIVDIGPITAGQWSERVSQAPFVVWNGPMGIYEDGFRAGTDALATALAQSQARAVVGGGDTIAALSKCSFDPARVFISTGGGAMLEFLANGTLPAIEALKNSKGTL